MNRILMIVEAIFLAVILALACSTGVNLGADDDNVSGDTDVDGDADADSDGDTDADTDTNPSGSPIPTTCAEAATALTSVGCEFFTVDMDNFDEIPGHDPADPLNYSVVVSNPQQSATAEVTLEDGMGTVLAEYTLEPLELQVIDVACETGCLVPPAEINFQGLGERTGFRVTSTVPIAAYQWNPYGHDIYTTDASLLIPVSSLSGIYIAATFSTLGGWTSQITIVGTEDGTQLTLIPSVDVPELNGIGPLPAGVESDPITINAADVLTITAELESAFDLTGTVVQADKNVVVFGGNPCANVPNGANCCCDHLEEQLLPLEAWGTSTVLARHSPRSTCTFLADQVLWRIIAGADNMTVTFDPPLLEHPRWENYGAEHHFAEQGEMIQFMSPWDHYVEGVLDAPADPLHPEAPFFAYQIMTSALYELYELIFGIPTHCNFYEGQGQYGDPYMLLSPPAGQYLDTYVFNTDHVFDFRWDEIILVRQAGVDVDLDCLGGLDNDQFSQVGASSWEVGRFYLDHPDIIIPCEDGPHHISSEQPFGLSVVGTDYCQSYGYLGGVGVRFINPLPVIE